MRNRWIAAAALATAMLVAAACSDDGGGSDTPTVPTFGAAAEATQAAVNTEEALAGGTATRAPGPTTLPTQASGTVVLATTATLVESGLLDVLLPMFEEESGYSVEMLNLSSATAIEAGSRGEADVLLVHDPAAEAAMVASGDGIERTLVMHNELIIVGPEADPANAHGQETANDVLQAIAATSSPFLSQGSASDTHARERQLFANAGIQPVGQAWYEETGQGMAATLEAASARQGYALADPGAFLSLRDSLEVVVQFNGDPALRSEYRVIVVNPEVHADVNATGARAFAAFLTRADVQQIIGEYGAAQYGEALFLPDAG